MSQSTVGAIGVSSTQSDHAAMVEANGAAGADAVGDPAADRLHQEVAQRERAQHHADGRWRPAVLLGPGRGCDAEIAAVRPEEDAAGEEDHDADRPVDRATRKPSPD